MTITRLVARPLLASVFLVGAVSALKDAEARAAKARKVTDPVAALANRTAPGIPFPHDPKTFVRLNAGVQLISGAAFATGRAPRMSAAILAATLVPTTIAGHAFWDETEPAAKAQQRLHFVKNTSILGGLLLASVDTDGKPGVAWRARRAALDVRREARQLAKSARREAKLARAQLT